MEPNVNPLVPDSSDPPGSTNPNSPYTPNQPGSTRPQFGNSTFKSRSITPLSADEASATLADKPPLSIPVSNSESVNIPPQPSPIEPPAPIAPIAQPEPPAQVPVGITGETAAGAFVGADSIVEPSNKVFTPTMPTNGQRPKRKFSLRSKPAIAGIAVLVLAIGFAAYYFGYKTNPSVIYSQSLNNSAKGYNKLIEYVDNQSKADYKGTVGNGSFNLKSSGFSTDGNIGFKSDDKNGELTFDVGAAGTRLSFDGRLIESSGGSQDIYLKASGIKGLGSLIGGSELDAPLAKLDGTWIVIDHTLLDSLTASASSNSKPSIMPPTAAQILDAAQGFGKVNQDYLFSTDKDKAVMTVVKKHGLETVDGHSTYHYTVALQKDNVKSYIEAQRAALKASKLNDWFKANGYDQIPDSVFNELKKSADSIKSSDTFDMWADIDQRLIYKIRFANKTNPVKNYIDVGLDYTGGDEFPFFIAGQSKDEYGKTNVKAVMNLNTKTQATDFSLDVKTSGYTSGTFGLKVTFKPTNQSVKIQKPANARSLADVLSELGYGNVLKELQATAAENSTGNNVQGGIQSKARDSKRSTDIKSIQVNLEAFYAQNGYYPSLSDMNNAAWRKANIKSFDSNAMVDPSNTSQTPKLASSPGTNVYSYFVANSKGQSCESDDTTCSKYTLTANFEGTVNGATKVTASNLDGS